MAQITYTFRVPYTVPTEAGTRHINVEAMYNEEAMRLVEGMIPNSSATWPTVVREYNSDNDNKGGFLSWFF